MLASLLPGFRDVRSALVAGYMWFCAGWLLIGHYHPPSADLPGKPAQELLELFGTGGRLAAISVLCLLIGEVTGTLVQSAFFQLSVAYLRKVTPENLGRWPRGPLAAFRPLSTRALMRVRGRIGLDYRLHQESTTSFRDAILLPLPVLAVAVCVDLSVPGWVKALLLSVTVIADGYLFAQARQRFRQAHSLISHSIADGTIRSGAMAGRESPIAPGER